MSLLSKEYLLKSLQYLEPTHKDIQTMKIYIKFNYKNAKEAFECFKFIFDRSSTFHRLNLYYLINEILFSNSEENLQFYIENFSELVLNNFNSDYFKVMQIPEFKGKYEEMKGVWIKKKVFNEEYFNN